MIYFTSDLHFWHEKLLKISEERNRFKNIEHMHSYIIKRWNNTVKDKDIVYVLGDFSLGNKKQLNKILDKLNGNITIIKGNHDRINLINAAYIEFGGKGYELVHNPLDSFSQNTIHGHIHKKHAKKINKQKNGRLFINVNTELWDYTPVSINSIIKLIHNKGDKK